MGASRESYRISHRWKWGGKTYIDKIKSVFRLFKYVVKYKNDRKLFVKDNFTQPFDRLIGCKLFGHDYHLDWEDHEYWCYKCWKRVKEEKYEGMVRRKKLLRIKKKI
jgi:hypothetical protein